MNTRSEQSDSQGDDLGDLPKNVAADRYGKGPLLNALRCWSHDYDELLESISSRMMHDPVLFDGILDEVTCLKEGLCIITQRGWLKGELEAKDKFWNPDKCMDEGSTIIEKIKWRDQANKEHNQAIIAQLEEIMQLLKYRLWQAKPYSYRAIYAQVLAGITLALGAHFIPEKQYTKPKEEIHIIEVEIPEIEEPEVDEKDRKDIVDYFPGKPKGPKKIIEKKTESDPGKKGKSITQDKPKKSQDGDSHKEKKSEQSSKGPVAKNEEVAKKEHDDKAPTKPDGYGHMDSGLDTRMGGSLLDGNGSSNKGKGGGGNQGTGLGTIDTGSGSGGHGGGMDRGIDTTLWKDLTGGNVLDGMSQKEQLRHVQKFLAQNNIHMDAHLATTLKRIIKGDIVAKADLEKAKKSIGELKEKTKYMNDVDMWPYVKTYIWHKQVEIEQLLEG